MPQENPMFAKFDAALGKTTPTTSTGPVSSRADEIRALANAPAPTDGTSSTDTFTDPLHNIAAGKSQDNLDAGKGAAKQLLKDFSSVGAQNAGPVGEKMMENAPGFAKDIKGLQDKTVSSNDAQKKGALDTSIAEGLVPVGEGAKAVTTGTKSALDAGKLALSSGNVDARLAVSAERVAKPADTYSAFADQAKKAATDVKADTPLSTVGSKIGDAFNQVIEKRQAVGQTMADELTKVKDMPVDLLKVPEGGKPVMGAGSKFATDIESGMGKMTTFDKQLIEEYTKQVQGLGANPTTKEVDDFLSRVPKELDLAKASKNVTDTTNAERIIKANLNEVRNTLTSQPGMEAYASARKGYANLSKFLDEGSKYLGGKSQSGDYIKDASVAKSSLQSILNGGKKDWLLSLEKHTGYPALDEGTLALQAMKDTGDPRGESLLKLMSDAPATKTGITRQILDYAGGKIKGALVGSPVEQTKTFLKSIESKGAASLKAVPEEAQTAINNHLTSAEQVLKNNPKTDIPGLIEQTRTNIADGLEHSGLKDIADKIRGIDLSAFKDWDSFKSAVLEYVKNAQPGLSMKTDTAVGASPAKVAKNLNGEDIKLVQDYANEPTLANLMKLHPALEGMGVDNLDPAMLQRFMKEVISERNIPTDEAVSKFSQDAVSGKMKGSKKKI